MSMPIYTRVFGMNSIRVYLAWIQDLGEFKSLLSRFLSPWHSLLFSYVQAHETAEFKSLLSRFLSPCYSAMFRLTKPHVPTVGSNSTGASVYFLVLKMQFKFSSSWNAQSLMLTPGMCGRSNGDVTRIWLITYLTNLLCETTRELVDLAHSPTSSTTCLWRARP